MLVNIFGKILLRENITSYSRKCFTYIIILLYNVIYIHHFINVFPMVIKRFSNVLFMFIVNVSNNLFSVILKIF